MKKGYDTRTSEGTGRDTIESIYADFMRANVPLDGMMNGSILGVQLGWSDGSTGDATIVAQRKLFSINEGDYLCIRLQSKDTFDDTRSLFNDFHEVKIIFNDDEYIQCERCRILEGPDEHEFFITGYLGGTQIDFEEITQATVRVFLGNRSTHLSYSDFYLCPLHFKAKGKAGKITFYEDMLQVDDTGSPLQQSRKVFDRDDNDSLNVFYKCTIKTEKFQICPTGAEMEFRYFDPDRQLVRQVMVRPEYDPNRDKTLYHDQPEIKSWRLGIYTLEVYLMGELLKTKTFTLQDEHTSQVGISLPHDAPPQISPAMRKLNDMIGLDEVKKVIRCNANFMKMMDMRHRLGLATSGRIMNMIFTGNPGTGKTTVARIIGKIWAEMHVLSKGHLVECNRESLIDNIVGGTEQKTRQMIDRSRGGVLFIDEGYSLMTEGSPNNDFGQRVIDTLMPVLSDEDSDRIVIMAGYEKEMQKLLHSNPGLASRFPLHLHFPDYTIDELMMMIQSYMKDNDYSFGEETALRMRRVIERASSVHTFGAGRFVHTFIQNMVLPNMATRLMEDEESSRMTVDRLTTVLPQDIPEPDEVLKRMGMVQARPAAIGFR